MPIIFPSDSLMFQDLVNVPSYARANGEKIFSKQVPVGLITPWMRLPDQPELFVAAASLRREVGESQLPGAAYSAFANSCPLQTDTFLFPLIHSHNVLPSSNKFY